MKIREIITTNQWEEQEWVTLISRINSTPVHARSIIQRFRKNSGLNWSQIDQHLSPGNKHKVGIALLQIAATRAAITAGLFNEILNQYVGDYRTISQSKIISCQDQWGNNLLHCLANSLRKERSNNMTLTVQDRNFSNYETILGSSQIFELKLFEKENNLGETPLAILNSVNIDIDIPECTSLTEGRTEIVYNQTSLF